jgi:peptide methionine sulfoxide reductase MsrA
LLRVVLVYEHVFEAVVGVDEAISGYAGGTTKILLMNNWF